jgi:biopolymer transport protein ExbD
MKLEMSLPERPGWIFAIPGFDFVALLLALVLLTGVVSNEGLVEVKLPSSEFRGFRLGDENPVVVMLKSSAAGPRYFVGGRETAESALDQVILEAAEERATRAVIIRVDEDVTMTERQTLINIIARLKGLRIFDGYRRAEKEEPAP